MSVSKIADHSKATETPMVTLLRNLETGAAGARLELRAWHLPASKFLFLVIRRNRIAGSRLY
ncbi:hypothetical protein CNECB9_1950010 [Cupriavidus necator]|uniref:Uncharacterized protein n=1 Tax=Cupriavidus necator TaxID=106590 RepID=A0A1K0IPA0_CUPNE|nr:hypothetical protein CNECB9_1950010 [Cupriavidus necator]